MDKKEKPRDFYLWLLVIGLCTSSFLNSLSDYKQRNDISEVRTILYENDIKTLELMEELFEYVKEQGGYIQEQIDVLRK